MTVVPGPVMVPLYGELPGSCIVRIVRHYVGCSLHARRDELGVLVGRGVDAPESVVGVQTNCAMFALGVLAAAGCPHPLLRTSYKVGMAFSWLVEIGDHYGAWRVAVASEIPPAGAVLWYRIDGTNDDHAEFMLEAPDEHGGGGRPDNAITSGRGNVHASMGRPLYRWLEPAALCLPDATAPDGDPSTAATDPAPPPVTESPE